MISTKFRKLLTGRTVMVWLAVTAFAGAGVAAAATGSAPWHDVPRATEAPTVVEPTTAPPTTVVPTTADSPSSTTLAAEVPSVPAGGTEGSDAGTLTTTAAEPPATTEPHRIEPTLPSTTVAEAAPAPTEPAPTTSLVTVPPPAPTTEAPTTTVAKVDTVVPLGIELHCTVDGATVSCGWSGGVVDGFAKYLLLRGDGKVGRVPFMSTDPSADHYVDTQVPAGSYSYVVVTIDGNSKTLVHSNPVFVQIGAAG